MAREVDPLPKEFPVGRFVNAAGRSGEHGKQNTYGYGCRCPFCTRAYSEYRFWWARKRGRKAASPWLEDGFLESRSGNTTPVDNYWFDRAVWKRATGELGFDWTLRDLRHAMVTWAVEAGVPMHVIQGDAGHSTSATTASGGEVVAVVRRDVPDGEVDGAGGGDGSVANAVDAVGLHPDVVEGDGGPGSLVLQGQDVAVA